jgi:hypothetical protein
MEQVCPQVGREFIAGLGSATAGWPLAARAQQAAVPVIGWLESRSPETERDGIPAFQQGLAETGYVEGRNVVVEYRWAENHNDRGAGTCSRSRSPPGGIAIGDEIAALETEAQSKLADAKGEFASRSEKIAAILWDVKQHHPEHLKGHLRARQDWP